MPVYEAVDNLSVEANHIYVIPPNRVLTIVTRLLKLHPRSKPAAPLRTIDFFLEALARDQLACAIGVILSGAASDGTLGLCAVKEEGGITFAQDQSADFDSMPRNAIAAGCVDFVLPPSGIAQELGRIAANASPHAVREKSGVRGPSPNLLNPASPLNHGDAPIQPRSFSENFSSFNRSPSRRAPRPPPLRLVGRYTWHPL